MERSVNRSVNRSMSRSISRRLALMSAAVSLVVFILVGAGLFVVVREQVLANLRESLDTRAELARMIIIHSPRAEQWSMVQEKLTDLTPRDRSTLFRVSSADPRFQFGRQINGKLEGEDHGEYRMVDPPGQKNQLIVTTVAIPPSTDRPPLQLTVANDCSAAQRMLRAFEIALATLIVVATGVMLLLSGAVAKFGLRSLTRLSEEASRLSPNKRHERLDTALLPRELCDLTISFNEALERLDGAYQRLESFNADVAHELRTPVGILIGQTEVMLTRDRSAQDLRQTLQSNLEELERMRAIINDMHFLSRADRGERATGLVEVSIAEEASRTVEFLEFSFEDAQLKMKVSGDARAAVNRSLFGRALTNLLVNATQHCRAGETVILEIAPHPDRVEISVSNPGAAIDPTVRAHLFDRFYRRDASRSNSHDSHGLGLSIVKAVAEMHNGFVFSRSEAGLNTFGFSVAKSAAVVPPDVATQGPALVNAVWAES